MDAPGNSHMCAGKIWVPDCVADGLAGGVGKEAHLGIDGQWTHTHLDIIRVDISTSNMAK
jgi:hypothetical protein